MNTPYTFHPLTFERLPEAEQLERSRQFLATMRKRRTVRDYSTEPVPFELIANAIATAGTAPSGANQQPWTFVVISSPDIKHQIRLAAEEEEKPHLEDAPYLIVVFRQAYGIGIDPTTGEEIKIKHYYTEESVGIAVGLLLASLHQAGFATLTHTPNPMGFLSTILQRPPNERAYVVIPVGYPAADAQVPVITKKPLDEIMVRFE